MRDSTAPQPESTGEVTLLRTYPIGVSVIVCIKSVLFCADEINRVAGDHGDDGTHKKMYRTGTKSIFSLADAIALSRFSHRRGRVPRTKFLSDCQLRDDVKVFVNVRIDEVVNSTAMGGVG
jgi:hypothetical protein